MKITDYEAGGEALWSLLKDTEFASVRRANVPTGEHPTLGRIIVIACLDGPTQVIETQYGPTIPTSKPRPAINNFALHPEPPVIKDQTATGAFFR